MKMILSLCVFFAAATLIAQQAFILVPVKTDHPQDTMATYINAMDDYKNGVETGDKHLEKRIDDAIRCFDFDGIVGAGKEYRRETAILMREVVDRVIVVDLSFVPVDKNMSSWRLAKTNFWISKVQTGDRAGQHLFNHSTIEQVRTDFETVKHAPYLQDSGGGAGYREPWVQQHVPKWALRNVLILANWQWIGIFAAILIGLILKVIVQHLLGALKTITSKVKGQWIHKIAIAIDRPGGLVAASIFWLFAMQALQLSGVVLTLMTVIVQVIMSIASVWLVYCMADVLTEYLTLLTSKTESTLDDHLVPLVNRALKVFIVVFGILFTFHNLGVNVVSAMAGLGIGGLAFALAAKDTCANLFGSIMIFLDRPFTIGDWVIVGSDEGTVEEIGFRSTRIRTFYNSLISVPNADVAASSVDNMGCREFRRIKAFFGLTYDTPPEKMEAFLEGLKNIVEANEYTRKDYYHIVFSGYGASSLDVMLYCFLKVPDWSVELVERQNIYLEILRMAQEVGVDFAYPTQSLHIETMPEKDPVRKPHTIDRKQLASSAKSFGPDGENACPGGMGLFVPPFETSRGSDDG
jgi:MscS family membrane protein